MGIVGHDDDITDYSPDGVAARVEAARSALRELDGATAADEVDVVTIAAMRERLGLQIELHDAGLDVGELNVIASPLQSMRDVFDLMATDTDEDWALIGRRMSRVPDRVAGYAAALRAAVAAGHAPAARQVARGIEQAGQIQQLFVDMVADARAGKRCAARGTATARRGCRRRLRHARRSAARRDRTRTPGGEDAFGRDAYRLLSREFLGTAVDLDETYRVGSAVSWKALSPNRSRSQTGSIPASRSARRCGGWTTNRATVARHRRAAGVDAGVCPTARWNRWPTSISISPRPCARWSVGSRRPRPAASTTPGRRRT